jgi:pyruvate/2-oxoacid:ferredoxin oxidoreductase beta subunit
MLALTLCTLQLLTAGSWRNTEAAAAAAAAAKAAAAKRKHSRRHLAAAANVPAAPVDFTDAYVQARNEAKGTQVWFSGDGSTTDSDAGTCITKARQFTLLFIMIILLYCDGFQQCLAAVVSESE